MPKHNHTPIQLPAVQPDCCAQCPLCGTVPREMRPKGSKENNVCLGTMEALGSRGIHVRASSKDSRHPWRRPCDTKWAAWMQLPNRRIYISTAAYLQCRVPYEQGQQLIIKFHRK